MLKHARWFAAAAIAVVMPLPALSSGCQGTCQSTDECASNEYCSIANGTCLTPKSLGFCKAKPSSCTDVAHLVCGCDGKEYANACEASKAGAAVANDGPCATSCGGAAKVACPSDQFCQLATGDCSGSLPTGTCQAKPETCLDVPGQSAVCGCDGKTYDSACAATKAGVSVLVATECPCDAAHACEDGRFCSYASGMCLNANPVGVCKLKPDTCNPGLSKVCGCDGKTYDNSCLAAKEGQSIASLNACPTISDAGPEAGPTGEILLISEVRTNGPGADAGVLNEQYSDEFIELYNPSSKTVTLDATWTLWHRSAQGGCVQQDLVRYVGKGQMIPSHGHFLLGGLTYTQNPPADDTMININPDSSLADAGSIWLTQAGAVVDAVCYYYDQTTHDDIGFCASKAYVCKGPPISNLPHCGTANSTCSVDASFERKPGGNLGNGTDTGNSSADFQTNIPSNPQNLASAPTP